MMNLMRQKDADGKTSTTEKYPGQEFEPSTLMTLFAEPRQYVKK